MAQPISKNPFEAPPTRTHDAVRDYLQHCEAEGQTYKTLAGKRSVLTRFADRFPILPDDPSYIFHFLGTMGGSQATRKSARGILVAFYTFICRRDGWVNPMVAVKVPKRAAKRPRTYAPALHMGGGANRRSNSSSITCPDCGNTIFFCPACGNPLNG